jgi:hypothetical protein
MRLTQVKPAMKRAALICVSLLLASGPAFAQSTGAAGGSAAGTGNGMAAGGSAGTGMGGTVKKGPTSPTQSNRGIVTGGNRTVGKRGPAGTPGGMNGGGGGGGAGGGGGT